MSTKFRRPVSDKNELCEVYVANGVDEAKLVEGKLQAFGIPAIVKSDGVYPLNVIGNFSSSGIIVLVPRKYLESALNLVQENRAEDNLQ
jgi:hypothetical protein